MPRPMTMAEKILAAHAGLDEVVPGQLIECDLDLVLSNDVTAPIAVKEFRKIGVEKVFDPTKIALVPDHYVPNKDIKSAEQAKIVRDFAREQGITHFYEVGQHGRGTRAARRSRAWWARARWSSARTAAPARVRRAGRVRHGRGLHRYGRRRLRPPGCAWFKVPESLLFKIEVTLQGKFRRYVIRQGRVVPHVIGDDRRGRRAVQVHGVRRRAACSAWPWTTASPSRNMAIEAGGKNGIFPVDDVTRAYLDGRVRTRDPRARSAVTRTRSTSARS